MSYDPLLPMVFQGEEISMAVRAWTHGYDFYAPASSAVFHEYEDFSPRRQHRRAVTPTFFEARGPSGRNATRELRAMLRLTALIRLNTTLPTSAYDSRATARYGLGIVRPAELFYSTFQLDLPRLRLWPLCPFVTSGRMHDELSPFLSPQGANGIDYVRATQSNYTIVGWRGIPVHIDDFPGVNVNALAVDAKAPGVHVLAAHAEFRLHNEAMDPLTIRHRHAHDAGRMLSDTACAMLQSMPGCAIAAVDANTPPVCNSQPERCCGDDHRRLTIPANDARPTRHISIAQPRRRNRLGQPSPRLLCASHTTGPYHEHHTAAAQVRTWLPRCNGAVVLSDVDDTHVPSVKVAHRLGVNNVSIGNWQRTRSNIR